MNAQLALETGLENQSSHLTSDLDKGPGQKNSQLCVSLPNSKEWSKEELWLDLTTLFKFYANMCTAVNVQHVVCKMLVNKTTSY